MTARRSPPRAAALGPLVAALLLVVPGSVLAACMKDNTGEVYCGGGACARDRNGTVWCSRFRDGDAVVTIEGEVLCGRGLCAKTFRGDVFCSSVREGAVMKDSSGRVRCQGSCEPASASFCEHTLADGAK